MSLPEKSLTPEEFEEAVLNEIMNQTPNLQKAVYKGELTDKDVVIDFIMNQPNVMPRYAYFDLIIFNFYQNPHIF